jgi:pimeloyl-ACP methyl ester carboxylesterase
MALDLRIATNGIHLACYDYPADSPGEGPVLLLMPGLTANRHAFDGLLAAGLARRQRVLALDLRGRGMSDKPDGPYDLASHAADVLDLIAALELERVVLGGHSFGGLLTLYMAARHPGRFERLLILDAALAATTAETRDLIKPALARLGQLYSSWDHYIGLIRQAPYFYGWQWDPMIESYYRADVERLPDGRVQQRSQAVHIGAAIDAVVAEDWPALLAQVREPALLINAVEPYGPPGAPAVVSEAAARETVATLPRCHYVKVPGNHMTMLYGAGATATVTAIEHFLEQE